MLAASVIAHRGASAVAPENTLPALAAAADAGARWVEIDAQVVADGTAVVFHDERLERCSNGRGQLITAEWPALRHLDAGSWFAPAFARTPIPRLEDALDLCRERDLGLNLELKVSPGAQLDRLAEGTLAAVSRRPLAPGQLLLSSFEPQLLARCRQAKPALPRGLICRRVPQELATLAARLELSTLHPDHRRLTARAIAAAEAVGLELYAWTVNDATRARRWLQAGVAGVITDQPAALIAAGLER
ncbi:glycerophosphodiester phosphodiesterase family protein [Spiribacter halobius]|uniref:Glycerophosphoryl diester phosphodiesterase n=1 Tax=Sediminicurvatus halobius TaxID=2182432 RepID=A0A2U2N1M6_9GAMM|nr:glycerophosphodiester phosphodiesterase family protein [Spiribacter halobius]PWG62973.1 glycerophosphoryl diester phosphodiesterase [Spiribacter halobius]UEX77487.1 hypothetical protein LMH63_16350 [Spiribacter halobius]